MLLQIELLYFVLMIGSFIALLLWAKLPSGICLMVSAVVGAVASAIFSQTDISLRFFVEGAFGYFDTILVITTAMVFMGAMQTCGALEYISAALVKAFYKVPSLLLISFMLIIMFPGMVTGSSLASAISAGALVAPIMIKWGIPKAKTGAIIATGSILGMVAPPINVPAMVICDVVDIPYTGFTVPLLILSIPLAIVTVLLLGRKYVTALTKEQIESVVDTSVLKELKWTVCIPLMVLVLLIVGEIFWPLVFGSFGISAMFVTATVICFFVGRRVPFWKKAEAKAVEAPAPVEDDNVIHPLPSKKRPEEKQADSVVEVLMQGVYKSFSAMGLLMGVGMFMEIITLNGVRGYFVINAMSLSDIWRYVSMGLALPVFGGISAFGSASILGGPFVMAFLSADNIYVTCGLSLLAALGEFLPPTAMSAMFASQIVEEKGWAKISKASITSILVIFVVTMFYTIGVAQWTKQISEGLLFLMFLVPAIVFAVVWEVLVQKSPKMRKYAYQVGGAAPAEPLESDDETKGGNE